MHRNRPRTSTLRPFLQSAVSEVLESRLLFAATPTIVSVTPAPGATNVVLGTTLTANLSLPNGAVDPLTDTTSNLYVYQTNFPNNNEKFLPGYLRTANSGTSIVFTPLTDLLPNTSYTLVVKSSLMDVNGDAFAPFTSSFTTGNFIPKVSQNYAFNEVTLPTAQNTDYTDVQFGPDDRLYASTTDGRIERFDINSDGTLGTPEIITSLQTAYGGNRLVTGFAFDPSFVADPTKPMLWVSNTFYALSGATNGPNFTSSLTVMSGQDLGTVQDAIIHLPRSIADHVNDTPVFQPGTRNLFFCQAGNNAFGAPDATWGNRAENLLSAAILEVNTAALNLSGPALDSLTPDGGGTYNPYASGAPLTIYATGIRNAFTLLFDDKGQLWAPINGSDAGGNSPAGPGVPALSHIQQAETDALEKVVQGAYYGHPNPVRNQFVLDQGHPSTGAIPALAFTAYPVGTNPDPNYHTPNFLFGLHSSPDGMIEYHGSAFGGALDGKFLVAEFSAPDDILVLSRDSNNDIIGGLVSKASSPLPDRAVSGITHLDDPITLTEDPRTGYLYISEYGENKLALFVPTTVAPKLTTNVTSQAFNAIATGYSGAAPSRIASITLADAGGNPLTFAAGSISIVNDPSATPAASAFKILNPPTLPMTLTAQNAFTLQVQYTASAVALQSALLQIKSNDPTTPTLDINLHGIGTAGVYGALEPSLVQVLRAHNIPTIVGAGPNDVNVNVTPYPQNPDPSSEEVPMQTMMQAAPGPVTITPIASFSASSQPVSQIGYYAPGNATARNALFTIGQADAQIVDPTAVGTTSFDPGGATFGLFAYFPGVTTPDHSPDYHYSEDALNTLDPTHPRKIRFFPYKTKNGTVVPNTFVFAVEDYNDPTYNSFVNFVGIISNVIAPPGVPQSFAANASGNSVVLNWTATFGAASYTVQREDPGSSTFTTLANGLASPTYTDTNVVAGGAYQYQVQAINAAGASAFTTSVSTTFAPTAPANLQVSSAVAGSVMLAWNPSNGADTYSVLRQDPAASSFLTIASGLTTTTFTDNNVINGQTYQYEVAAQNAGGASAATNPITAAVPEPVQTLDVTVGKGANKQLQFVSAAGTLVTVKLAGQGTATVHLDATTLSQTTSKAGVVVTGDNVAIAGISTSATAGNSILSVTTRAGSNSVNFGGIVVGGSLNSIVAPTSMLVGTLSVAAAINKISLGAAAGATITVGGTLGTLHVASVAGLALTSGVIRNITAGTWASTQPITASLIGAVTINGDAQLNVQAGVLRSVRVKGSLHDSTLMLSAAGAQDLTFLAAGAINNTILDTAGNIGTITTGLLSGSQIYSGTGAQGTMAFPPVSGGFPAAATISSIILKKTRGAVSMTNSSIAASKIRLLSLGNIQFSNGGKAFGVEANDIATLRATDSSTGHTFTLTKLNSPAAVAAEQAAKGVALQDFAITVL